MHEADKRDSALRQVASYILGELTLTGAPALRAAAEARKVHDDFILAAEPSVPAGANNQTEERRAAFLIASRLPLDKVSAGRVLDLVTLGLGGSGVR